MKSSILIFFFSFSLPFYLLSQSIDEKSNSIVEERVEFILFNTEGENLDYTTLFDELIERIENPISLNQCTARELQSLHLLSDVQIRDILKHRKEYGNFLGIEELQAVESLDLATILRIQPFINVKRNQERPHLSAMQILQEGNWTYLLRYSRNLQTQEGFKAKLDPVSNEQKADYLGSQDKIYSRLRYQFPGLISFGITTEKDAGEEFFKGSQKQGFDFYSGHLFAENLGIIKQAVIGDFQAQFGQGLTYWSGLAFGGSAGIMGLKRNAPKLRPYTSAQENNFLRGIGLTLGSKKVTTTLFASHKAIDARILESESFDSIGSINQSGFHRSNSELAYKNTSFKSTIGANINFEGSSFEVGLTAVQEHIDKVIASKRKPYQLFESNQSSQAIGGLNYSYLIKGLNLFGEICIDQNLKMGITQSAIWTLDPTLSILIHSRLFPKNLQSVQNNAIAAANQAANEQGIQLGLEWQFHPSYKFAANVDQYYHPWLKFLSSSSSRGKSINMQFDYAPNKTLKAYLRYRIVSRQRNSSNSDEKNIPLHHEVNSRYRIHLSKKINKQFTLKSRIEWSHYQFNTSQSNGVLVFQELKYSSIDFPHSFSIRYALFETSSYDDRIYAFESDVLYAFSIPAFYGKGSRFYILTKIKIQKRLDLWLRYGQTLYADRNEIGSGKNRIKGNLKSDVKVQLRLKF